MGTMGRQNGVIERIRERLDGRSAYECAVCSLQFDRERLNCPACGCSEFTEY